MPVYIQLIKWTEQGRKVVDSLPDRVDAVQKQIEDMGVKVIGNWMTMGQYDQIAIAEAPDDATVAKISAIIAGRGNAVTETLRAFDMNEVRKILSS
ncbi:MAG: GYD domain-containing protein [Acidimicrobiia bacterium]